MPLPFLIIGAAILAGGTGIAGGVSGAKKIYDAKDILRSAQYNFDKKKTNLDIKQEKTVIALDELGKLKLDIWKSFKRFSDAFEKIKNKPQFTKDRSEQFTFSKHELDVIKNISITALNVLGSSILSAGAGALVGFAAYGGTMALGVASTGTVISSLSGVAAYNATMAALGGGALSVGGGGMALGSIVLSGAIAGPVIAVGGLLLNAKGNSSMNKAIKVREEVYKALELMDESLIYLGKLKGVSIALENELKQVYSLYEKQVSILEFIVSREINYNMYTSEEKKIVDNNIMLVKLLKQITQVDLIKKQNNKDVVQECEIEREIDNSQMIRKNGGYGIIKNENINVTEVDTLKVELPFEICEDKPASVIIEYNERGFIKNTTRHKNGTKYDDDGFDKYGYDKDRYGMNNFKLDGYHKNGTKFNNDGFDKYGYDIDGYNKEAFDKNGYNKEGHDINGFKLNEYPKNVTKYDEKGFIKNTTRHRNGTKYDDEGFDKYGNDINGFKIDGYSRVKSNSTV